MTTLPKGSDFTNTLRHIDVVETPDQRFYDPVCVKYKMKSWIGHMLLICKCEKCSRDVVG